MKVDKFPCDLEISLLCSFYKEIGRMHLTDVTWSYEYLEKSGIPKNLKRDKQKIKYEKKHPLESIFPVSKRFTNQFRYDLITIWMVEKLENKYLVYTPGCDHLLYIKDYSYEWNWNSWDVRTRSSVTLCPMDIGYAIKMEYIHVNDILNL